MSVIEVVVHVPSVSAAAHVAISIQPVIHVDYFSSKTFAEWMASDRSTLTSKSMNHTYQVGDAVVLVLDKCCIVGVAVIGASCRKAGAADRKIYSGEDSQRNAYITQLKACRLLPEPFSFEDVRRFCGIPEGDKEHTNICKGCPFRAELFYGVKGLPSIYIERYKMLAKTWMP